MKKTVAVIILALALAIASIIIWTQWSPAKDRAIIQQCDERLSENARFVRALADTTGTECASLASKHDRAICSAWATRDPARCPAASEQTCPPIAARDPDACIPEDGWCRAMASGDPALCTGPAFIDDEDRKDCAAWVNRDEAFFDVTQDCVNAERANAAVTRHDEKLCAKITDAALQDSCLKNVAALG